MNDDHKKQAAMLRPDTLPVNDRGKATRTMVETGQTKSIAAEHRDAIKL